MIFLNLTIFLLLTLFLSTIIMFVDFSTLNIEQFKYKTERKPVIYV